MFTINGFKFVREITPIRTKFYKLVIDYPKSSYQLFSSSLTKNYCLYDEVNDRMFEIETSENLADPKISGNLFIIYENFIYSK